jgi:hypothetical protein
MKTTRILIICSLAAFLLATAVGCSGQAVSKKPSATAPSQAKSGSPAFVGSVTETAVQNIQEGVEPSTQIPAVSPSAAQAKTGIALKLPKDTSTAGDLKAIYPDTSASGNPELCLHFTNGVLISEEAWKTQPDFAKEIASDSDPVHHEPPLTPGSNWKLVDVAGFQGKLLPQPAVLGPDQKVHQLAPMLEWWANGVKYWMSAWKLGYSGEQLLDIANSMY